jgi:hypothetical protein
MNTNSHFSYGDEFDKLSILDIKLNKIKDDNLDNIKKEYNILYNQLKIYIDKLLFYYNILKQINIDSWEIQNIDNDQKNKIKNKINYLINLSLNEQNDYKLKKAFVLTHLGLGDNITAVGMVRYLSTCYDEVVVVCKIMNKENLELFYKDDISIKLYIVNNDRDISVRSGCNINKFNEITKSYDIYMCGYHLYKKFEVHKMPMCFYEHLKLNPKIFWTYFYIPIIDESKILYNKLGIEKYVFIHNMGSIGKIFDISFVEEKLNLNKNDILFINPNINCYNENEHFYELANKFIGYRLSFYSEIIKNALYNIVSDSSFMCMAINLDIKNNNNYFIARNNNKYLIYSEKYFKLSYNKKIFKQILS